MMEIKINPKAALNYHSRCYDKPDGTRCKGGPYHNRFHVNRLEKMAGNWYEVQSEWPTHFITMPIEGIDDLGIKIDKQDVCETNHAPKLAASR